jgi:hypothetical protein
MNYFGITNGQIRRWPHPPLTMRLWAGNPPEFVPPLIGALHRNFADWGESGYSPGPIIPERIWFGPEGELAFAFADQTAPSPALQVGLAPELAAWLVLLDKAMETFVVVARARAVWPVADLARALTFLTPAFLPTALVQQPPDNWQRVAQALALAVADGPLRGTSQDRHWQS